MKHVLFNYSNIEALTWIDQQEIKMIHVKANQECYITLKTGEKIRITAKDIEKVMQEKRQARMKNIKITNNFDGTYTAQNTIKETEYILTPYDDHITCTCPDYNNQSIALSTYKVCCKHIYKLLSHLACNSLEDYADMICAIAEEQINRQYQEHLEKEDYQHLAHD